MTEPLKIEIVGQGVSGGGAGTGGGSNSTGNKQQQENVDKGMTSFVSGLGGPQLAGMIGASTVAGIATFLVKEGSKIIRKGVDESNMGQASNTYLVGILGGIINLPFAIWTQLKEKIGGDEDGSSFTDVIKFVTNPAGFIAHKITGEDIFDTYTIGESFRKAIMMWSDEENRALFGEWFDENIGHEVEEGFEDLKDYWINMWYDFSWKFILPDINTDEDGKIAIGELRTFMFWEFAGLINVEDLFDGWGQLDPKKAFKKTSVDVKIQFATSIAKFAKRMAELGKYVDNKDWDGLATWAVKVARDV